MQEFNILKGYHFLIFDILLNPEEYIIGEPNLFVFLISFFFSGDVIALVFYFFFWYFLFLMVCLWMFTIIFFFFVLLSLGKDSGKFIVFAFSCYHFVI